VDNTIESSKSPEAEYKDMGFILNAVYRLRISRIRFKATGGLVVHEIFEGHLDNLFFQNAIMVSRGLIFNSSALLHTRWVDTTQVGANIGLRATLQLTSRLALFVEGRYLLFEENIHRTALELTGRSRVFLERR
jgi:hypothetical protein